jgi:putative ABC transport system substrate-binding protein
LVDRQVEVIVTTPTEPTIAAKRATSNIPIVFIQVGNPIQVGIVTNLARPDANVTGMSALGTDLAGKRLALLKEALPSATRISILWNRPSKGAAMVLDETLAACKSLGIEPQDIGVSERAEFDHAFDAAVSNRSAAILVIDDPVILGHVAVRKLPLFSSYSQFVTNGGFMAYGPDLPSLFRRGAEYVDLILHGARPADLPVEQPDKFKLILNLKTAKLLGIDIPPTLLARADEVIE